MFEDHMLDSRLDAIKIMIRIEYVGIKMWKLCLWQVCLEDIDGVSSNMNLQVIIIMKNEEMKCNFKMRHDQRRLMVIIYMWRHAQRRGSPIGVWGSNLQVILKQDHGYVKTFRKNRVSHMFMGEQFASLHQSSAIKKEGPSWDEQDRHHLAQVDHAQGKGMILIGHLSYRSRGGSCETGV